jgi:glycosyltransferase involved in cell wall biosynthesis
MASIKIVIVGDPGSIHAARFVGLLQEIGYEIILFHSGFVYRQDEHLKNTKLFVAFPFQLPRNGNRIKGNGSFVSAIISILGRNDKRSTFLHKFIDKYLSDNYKSRVKHLTQIIKKWKPAIVISLKMQDEGYTVSAAKEFMRKKFNCIWIHFNWGTDIEFFGKHPDYKNIHIPRIKKALNQCDYFIADCKRDVKQAQSYGFKGKNLGDCIATGGFDINELRTIRLKTGNIPRRIILIKGREGGLVGKAYTILAALHNCRCLLDPFIIKIFYSTPNVAHVAEFLKRMDGIEYEIISRVPYHDLLSIYSQSLIAISASDVDGTPSFLLEAMALGAFPIHSDMESIREWITNGENGLLFPVDDVDALTDCLKRAISDSFLRDSAQQKNWKIAEDRMDRLKIKGHIQNLIENVVLRNSIIHKDG